MRRLAHDEAGRRADQTRSGNGENPGDNGVSLHFEQVRYGVLRDRTRFVLEPIHSADDVFEFIGQFGGFLEPLAGGANYR